MTVRSGKGSCKGRCGCGMPVDRRNFIKLAGGGSLAVLAGGMPVMAGPFTREDFENLVPADKKLSPEWVQSLFARGEPHVYRGDGLRYIGMPVGGLCAGQIYLGGDGTLWHWDIFNRHIGTFDGHYAKPVIPSSPVAQGFALRVTRGGRTETRALNRTGFPGVTFRGEYPIGLVEYRSDPPAPVAVSLEAFSPFIPLAYDDSSLPATVLRFTLKNTTDEPVEAALYGWLENAVCLNHRAAPGTRHNRIVRAAGVSFLDCFVRKAPEPEGPREPDLLFEDWNRETYDGWVAQGEAFGKGPILKSAIPAYQGDVGGDTERVVNSHATAPGEGVGVKDSATGTLTSGAFTIERDYIHVWVGGGPHEGKTCLNVLVDGAAVRSVTGKGDNRMALVGIDVREFRGREARLQVVDAERGAWGNIGVGRITFSDAPVAGEALDRLEDYGTMGLALLGAPAELVATFGGEAFPEMGEAFAASEVSVCLADALVGGLGRTLVLPAGGSAVVTFAVTWHFPNLKIPGPGRHYATRFASALGVAEHIARNYERLHALTRLWRDTWYDATLPYWFLDRTFANASTLATSTAFRFADGRFWGWEGVGCCSGTCTHVWHYEQTMGRLFPELDIVLREKTDFNPAAAFQPSGAVGYRGAGGFAVDGQAGIILRCLRGHQVSPDDTFLKRNWPHIKKALQWLMAQDVNGDGILNANQHNTLDAQWYGEVAWLSGLYLAAVRAGEIMALEVGDGAFAAQCRGIVTAGRESLVDRLWNGEYFFHAGDPQRANTVGSYDGCHIDQVLGQSWAYQVGLGEVLPREQTRTALRSLWKYNFTPDVGPYREAYRAGRWYAMAGEAGTVMCTWPRGEAKRVQTAFDYYFNECMNGFEYQLAGHMLWEHMLQEGLAITRAIHDRYDGSKRNPWNEVECGDHYARSMASYGVFLAACGFEYHGPRGHIGFAPRLTPEHFKAAFTAAEGWGTYEQRCRGSDIKSRIAVRCGRLRVKTIALAVEPDGWAGEVAVSLNGQDRRCSHACEGGRLLIALDEPVDVRAGAALEIAGR